MRPRDLNDPQTPRGRFPRPNMTLRELIGLVLAFAVSNAFLAWMNPWAASNQILFGIWNGLLTLYLGFAFLQSWVRSVIRWTTKGHAEPPSRRARKWTALGVAEATVIGGTMFGCSMLMLERARGSDLGGSGDWVAPTAILVIGSGAAIPLLRSWREESGESLTGRAAGSTMEGRARIERGETS